MTLAKIQGVRIAFDNLFLVLFIVYAWAGLLWEIALIFGIVLIHEATHVIVASCYGMKVDEIEILPFGGVARLQDPLEIDPAAEIMVALSGPVANLLLVLGGIWCASNFKVFEGIWDFMIESNLALATFNALPILPLDGGRVLRAALVPHMGLRDATFVMIRVGSILSILLAILSIGGFALGWLNVTAPIVSIFLLGAVTKERRQAGFTQARQLVRKIGALNRERVLSVEALAVRGSTHLLAIIRRFVPHKYHVIFVLDEVGGVKGILSEDAIISGATRYGVDISVDRLL